MLQQSLPKLAAVTALCGHCAGPMRLVTSEPHAVEPHVDVHTFACTVCGFTQALTIPLDTAMN